ncbi:DNA-dependent DNA helicase and ATPase [Thecamonas trahens ATCC 50062]|uniref:DNA helicase n=1 Tax=Thecamonas trahens ATCC 50062 TaxID=461836 RepID=A0A0L0DKY3_THETB|nr:DNA-dependent DNA helicase and ATPase [Thecamonas trahens ATCC 50062]KNC52686.1 DNA-dependent DNA helicase and ATPase [Thecamonas trahens ATCC 50062]|eukprot:XP_013755230.1 DNA-dependent DNA helicase and ATPase [Thecamonas trahens ATCC 50062]
MDSAPRFDDRAPLGWAVYFPMLGCDASSALVQLIRNFVVYFSEKHVLDKAKVLESLVVYVDWGEMVAESLVPGIDELVFEDPARSLAAMAVAAVEVVYSDCVGTGLPASFKKITARLCNHPTTTPIRSLKSHYIGRLVSVRGTVVRTSAIKPLVVSMDFVCTKCDGVIGMDFVDGKYSPPLSCGLDGCKSKTFEADRASALTVDWQKVRIQEILDDSNYEAGRIPRTIESELTGTLVDCCVPGDVISVTGEVKVVSSSSSASASRKAKTLFVLYIDANMVSRQGKTGESDGMHYTVKDMQMVNEIAHVDDVLHLLVNSLCPSIYGHELVKAGWLLALFGGTQKFSLEKDRIAVRGDPHVLVVGDPGMGKSQLLRSVASAAPRGVYVCGNTTSTTGLTVTLLKDPLSGDYALEAGALVLGDQGCCCIDEFDKMKSEHHALLEAMEQQSVSIAKAGIVANLPARTSVLAAANPVGGHYTHAKTVAENVHLAPALLSRFDLIFVLVDKPDHERDAKLSEHVMLMHGGGQYSRKGRPSSTYSALSASGVLDPSYKSQLMSALDRATAATASTATGARSNEAGSGERRPLADRLKLRKAKTFDPLPHVLMRKYIGYAREYVKPVLSLPAADLLQDFYLSLRKSHVGGESMPVTTRQLESMIRLAEARAKLELRELVTADDALDVIELMKESLIDVYVDASGTALGARAAAGGSKKKVMKAYVGELTRISEATYNSLFTMQQLYKVATDLGLAASDFRDMVGQLNQHGYLIKKRNNVYQLASSSVADGGWAPMASDQEPAYRFATDLWDGFDVVVEHTDTGLQALKEVTNVIKKRAELELEYSKKLAKLASHPSTRRVFETTGNSIESQQLGTCASAWTSFLDACMEQANAHADAATSLDETVVTSLNSFIKDMESARKTIVADGQRRLKEKKEAEDAVAKAKTSYFKASESYNSAVAAHDAALNNPTAKTKDVTKAKSKMAKASTALEQSVQEYQFQVKGANKVQTRFLSRHMPKIMDDLQHLSTVRIHILKTNLRKTALTLESPPPRTAKAVLTFKGVVAAIDNDSDMRAFITENKTFQLPPPPFEFEEHGAVGAARSKKAKRGAVEANPATSIFGVSIEEVLAKKVACHPAMGNLPRLIPVLCHGILAKGGPKAEGLFRLSGENKLVKDLKARLDAGNYDVADIDSVHVLTGALKLWFRELKDPLIPEPLYDQAVAAATEADAAAIFNDLSAPRQTIIQYLMGFLATISTPEIVTVTKMTTDNLALIFAPSFLRCSDPAQMMVNAERERVFVKLLFLWLSAQDTTAALYASIPAPTPPRPRPDMPRYLVVNKSTITHGSASASPSLPIYSYCSSPPVAIPAGVWK